MPSNESPDHNRRMLGLHRLASEGHPWHRSTAALADSPLRESTSLNAGDRPSSYCTTNLNSHMGHGKEQQSHAQPDLAFGDDVYAEAWDAMAKLQEEDLEKVPSSRIESALSAVSIALGVLATAWPALDDKIVVRTAVDFTKNTMVTSKTIRKRIAGVQLLRAELLCSLFQLRDYEPEPVMVGDKIHSGELELICVDIRIIIVALGNLCDNYVDAGMIGRNIEIRGESGTLQRTDWKIFGRRQTKKILQLLKFRQKAGAIKSLFDTAKEEEEMAKAVVSQGGAKACMEESEKLNKLAGLVPRDEDSVRRGPKSSDKKIQLSSAEIRRIRTPVKKLLEDSIGHFETKLDILINRQQRDSKALNTILKFASGQPYERIQNHDIKKLWKGMGWGGSVDCNVFILNLYDYFVDLEREARAKNGGGLQIAMAPPNNADMPGSGSAEPPSSPPVPSNSADAAEADSDDFLHCTTPEEAARDAWCLQYLNYRTLSTFTEVLDDDMNGLIKVKEANEFTAMMPPGVTLMQWTVYCASGWLISAHIYRLRIEWIIEKMITASWAKENSSNIVGYIDCLRWVVAFLRSLGEPELQDPSLLKVTRIVMDHQEQELRNVLEPLDYSLGDGFIESMLSSSYGVPSGIIGRIEELVILSKTHFIDAGVFQEAYDSVDTLTDLLVGRAQHLCTRFAETQDPGSERKILAIANGMFQEIRKILEAESITRVMILRSDEHDEGYEEIVSYRFRFGIRLASAVRHASAAEDVSDACSDAEYDSPVEHTMPPLLHDPQAIAATHTAEHRFLAIERNCSPAVTSAITYALRNGLEAATGIELISFDPLIEYCLSAPDDPVADVAKALVEYRERCLDANTKEGVPIGPVLSGYPPLAEFAQSQSDRWLQAKEAQEQCKRPVQLSKASRAPAMGMTAASPGRAP
ncbi:uncharacterized protein TRAVEDRAFT_18782 [Trametes versicolor FP-101664 SS1]|uniref:uncharacterized protein n=1 Tax=Trametes versicolor (strain FP-101664) TaxID=717944 RepID=UPI0004623251|nr:uncharacterized protein TRAVEDRAFT_18782 [Trametes versicolor FP-101664 SS1]EIW62377.1 hypothetical protein TRAVEDRAFT_18782 [Trametes versicolor FP-101664 SS1]